VTGFTSPFLELPESAWLCSNELAFVLFDGFPVSHGHALVVTRRLVETWFDATPAEQSAVMDLVNRTKEILDTRLSPRPDGYNVGFNAGSSAGQTVPHLHVHVIPRYKGDVDDPCGGVRHVIPGKGNYRTGPKTTPSARTLNLSSGFPDDPVWRRIGPRLQGATEVDILASFVQPSGLDLIQSALLLAVKAGARVRILVGDYLYITAPEALRRLLVWMELTQEEFGADCCFQVRLAEIKSLQAKPESFHPKAWRIADQAGGLIVVGSSNISKAALETGIEWNLIGNLPQSDELNTELLKAFGALWDPVEPRVLELIPAPPQSEQYTRFVPVYTLEAAAGLWGPESEPEEAGWTDVSAFKPRPGMFVIKVRGRSMEPKIPDGSWCLFRKCPPGSREGKIVLVQFNAMGDPETGGRYTVKRYHSEKTVTEESWAHQRIQLLPLNPDFQPIEVDPQEADEMLVIGEFVGVV
jgi:diadenosine tetraphosphate (Ap4A) HIT family hydrolase/HKD family nuclease